MNIIYFLKNRTAFIRQLYYVTSAPYIDRIQKIENEEEPFVALYSSRECSGESPFQAEYNEASESLDTLSIMYTSMLKSVLHSYLETWINKSGIPVNKELLKKTFKNRGWFWGYSDHFKHCLDIDFKKAPVDLKIIEEVILVRNNSEHQSSIAGRPQYTIKDYENLKSLSFTDELSSRILQEIGFCTFLSPPIHITEEQLLEAISTVEKFSEWFNNEIEPKIYPSLAKN